MPTVKLQLAPGIVVDDRNNIWQAFDDGMAGMGAINWQKIGDFTAPLIGAAAGWIASKGQKNQYPQYPPGYVPGANLSATNNGLFGGIDTTTLLLIGGAVLLFMSTPAKKG